MKKLLRRIVGVSSILALFLCIFIRLMPTHAETPAVTAESITSYSFNAASGDSLSRIVRRALQLRSVTDQPTALYCENIITSQLGGEYIEVGQQVVVSFAQIDACTAAAKNLDSSERAAWQAYADTVMFDVSDVNPTNNSSNVVVPSPPSEPAPAPSTPPKPPKAPQALSVPFKPAASPKFRITKGWLGVGAAAIAIVIFMLPVRRNNTRR